MHCSFTTKKPYISSFSSPFFNAFNSLFRCPTGRTDQLHEVAEKRYMLLWCTKSRVELAWVCLHLIHLFCINSILTFLRYSEESRMADQAMILLGRTELIYILAIFLHHSSCNYLVLPCIQSGASSKPDCHASTRSLDLSGSSSIIELMWSSSPTLNSKLSLQNK